MSKRERYGEEDEEAEQGDKREAEDTMNVGKVEEKNVENMEEDENGKMIINNNDFGWINKLLLAYENSLEELLRDKR